MPSEERTLVMVNSMSRDVGELIDHGELDVRPWCTRMASLLDALNPRRYCRLLWILNMVGIGHLWNHGLGGLGKSVTADDEAGGKGGQQENSEAHLQSQHPSQFVKCNRMSPGRH